VDWIGERSLELLEEPMNRRVVQSQVGVRGKSLQSRNRLTVAVLIVGCCIMGIYPASFLLKPNTPSYSQPEPLRNHEVRRGMFLNSGSKDMGIDPDWKDGVYNPKSSLKSNDSD